VFFFFCFQNIDPGEQRPVSGAGLGPEGRVFRSSQCEAWGCKVSKREVSKSLEVFLVPRNISGTMSSCLFYCAVPSNCPLVLSAHHGRVQHAGKKQASQSSGSQSTAAIDCTLSDSGKAKTVNPPARRNATALGLKEGFG